MPQRSRPVAPAARVATALLLALGLVGCGSDDGDAGAGATSAATAAADEARASSTGGTSAPEGEQESEAVTVTAVDFELQLDEDTFGAGEVEFTLVNDGGSTHDLVLERDGREIAAAAAVGPGRSSTVTVKLEPGEYVLYCSIADHRAMGMETTIEVG